MQRRALDSRTERRYLWGRAVPIVRIRGNGEHGGAAQYKSSPFQYLSHHRESSDDDIPAQSGCGNPTQVPTKLAKVAAPEQRTTKAMARMAGSFMLPKDPNCRLRAQTLRNSIVTPLRIEPPVSQMPRRNECAGR